MYLTLFEKGVDTARKIVIYLGVVCALMALAQTSGSEGAVETYNKLKNIEFVKQFAQGWPERNLDSFFYDVILNTSFDKFSTRHVEGVAVIGGRESSLLDQPGIHGLQERFPIELPFCLRNYAVLTRTLDNNWSKYSFRTTSYPAPGPEWDYYLPETGYGRVQDDHFAIKAPETLNEAADFWNLLGMIRQMHRIDLRVLENGFFSGTASASKYHSGIRADAALTLDSSVDACGDRSQWVLSGKLSPDKGGHKIPGSARQVNQNKEIDFELELYFDVQTPAHFSASLYPELDGTHASKDFTTHFGVRGDIATEVEEIDIREFLISRMPDKYAFYAPESHLPFELAFPGLDDISETLGSAPIDVVIRYLESELKAKSSRSHIQVAGISFPYSALLVSAALAIIILQCFLMLTCGQLRRLLQFTIRDDVQTEYCRHVSYAGSPAARVSIVSMAVLFPFGFGVISLYAVYKLHPELAVGLLAALVASSFLATSELIKVWSLSISSHAVSREASQNSQKVSARRQED